jgi:hypothetical protein
MILVNPNNEIYLKSPRELDTLPDLQLFVLKSLAEKGELLFFFPKELKKAKEKRVYKVGFLNELYVNLFFKSKENRWSKDKIFNFVTNKFDIFIERRQYQKDVKEFKKYVFDRDK